MKICQLCLKIHGIILSHDHNKESMSALIEKDTIRIKGKPVIKIFESKVLAGKLYQFNPGLVMTENEVMELVYLLMEKLKI